MRAAEGYVRGAYFIVARRRLSSLEGPRSWGHLGVDRSLLFFPALLKPRPDRVSFSGNEYVWPLPSKWQRRFTAFTCMRKDA